MLFTLKKDFNMNSLTINSIRSNQPDNINIQLKAHQLAMVHAMITHEKTEHYNDDDTEYRFNMGVLCDPVGSGKSFSILGLIAAGKHAFPEERKYSSSSEFATTQIKRVNAHTEIQYQKYEYSHNCSKPETIPVDVIIVAHTIVKQWCTYIKDQTNLKYLLINSKKTVTALVNKEPDVGRTKQEIVDELSKYDIILISSTRLTEYYNRLCIYSSIHRYNRIIIDEADSINIPNINLDARFFWYITSSYKTLQNPGGMTKYKDIHGAITDTYTYGATRIHIRGVTDRKHQVYNAFNSIQSSYYTSINKFIYFRNSREFIKGSFLLEEPIMNIIACANPIALNVLKGIVDDTIISLINAGNITGAIEQITCIKATTDNITEAVTNKLQVELNNERLRYTMKSQMQYSNQQAKDAALKRSMEIQDGLTNKIELIKERLIENSQCPICFDEPETITITNCCKNTFCFECITMSMKHNPKCPHCRAELNTSDLIIQVQSDAAAAAAGAADDGPLEKNAALEKLLVEIFDRPKRAKVLIFSEHENIFITVGGFLSTKNIISSRLIGSSSTIQSNINKFKTPHDEGVSLDVLLLNSRHCGSGLNIENATDVIVYHSMSPELEMQVIGRAQRPGRTSRLNIWKLQHENETTT
jgi:SNF2 family DNA or RNA helicase